MTIATAQPRTRDQENEPAWLTDAMPAPARSGVTEGARWRAGVQPTGVGAAFLALAMICASARQLGVLEEVGGEDVTAMPIGDESKGENVARRGWRRHDRGASRIADRAWAAGRSHVGV